MSVLILCTIYFFSFIKKTIEDENKIKIIDNVAIYRQYKNSKTKTERICKICYLQNAVPFTTNPQTNVVYYP